MRKKGYYSSGQFAKMAGVTVRTIRFYDRSNILKPSCVSESGARFYTDTDLARLQQILLLKYLGFSLEQIREMTIDDADYHFMLNSMKLQQKLVDDRIEQLQLVKKALGDTADMIEQNENIDWKNMLELIHLTSMENSLAQQYRTSSNLSARIRLHTLYSENKQGWFPWVYEQCRIGDGLRILELGCGNGALWLENISALPPHISVCLSDISEGMIRDVRRTLGHDSRFTFASFDCQEIPFREESFDLVIAGHVLFYCSDVEKACREVRRVLKAGGRFVCSTYGSHHMEEITRLVRDFDSRIVLSADRLYERFGLHNGAEILSGSFDHVREEDYQDALNVTEEGPLIEYILSCHGNQGEYIPDRYKDFRQFVQGKVRGGLHITKQAGIFVCT